MKDGINNCYEAAGRLISLQKGSSYLVHGKIYSTKLNQFIWHAWVETGEKVMDYSNSRRLIIPKKDYYREGQITETIRYTRKEAIFLLRTTGKFELWSEETTSTLLGPYSESDSDNENSSQSAPNQKNP